MSLNFVEKNFILNGNSTANNTLIFYKKGFELGSLQAPEPTWQDIILSGNTALTLVNAKADGLNYLKLFGECELRNLPLGYTQLDWIQGGNGAYIDTGITPSCDVLRVKWKGQLADSAYQGSFIGCVGGTSPRAGFRIFSNANTANLNLQSYGSLLYPDYPVANINTVDVTYDNINKTITGYCNSTTINETNANINTNFNKNMLLFGAYIGDTLGTAMASKCWGLLVEKDGVMVLNYIPAKRNSDNAIGMYDTVTNTFLTNAGTGDFVAGGAVVPSIDNPVDIICNNGKLAIKNKYLPLEYEEVNGLTGDGTAYIDLNTGLTQADEIEIKFSISSATLKEGVFGYRNSANRNNIGIAFASNDNTEIVLDFNNSAYATYRLMQPLSVNTIYTLKINKTRRAVYNGDTLIAENATVCNDTITTSTCYLFAMAGSPAFADRFKGTIYSCSIKNKRNMITCRRKSDNVLGMYDTVSKTFFTNATTGSFTAGDVVVNDYELYVDGVTETVNIHNKNIWSNSKTSVSGVGYSITDTDYGFIATAGASTGNSSRAVIYVDVDVFKANTTYVISGIDGYKSVYVGRTVNGTNDTGYYKNGGSGRSFTITDIAEGQSRFIISIYLGTKDKGFVFDFSQIQIEEGSTSTEYEIPYIGGIATAENLLSVDEYRDVQDVLTGKVTYNTMTYVVDGTEDWDKYRANNGYSCFRISSGLGLRSKRRIGISNYLPYYNVTTASLDREAFTIGSNMTAFYITLANENMTLEEFTNWLKSLCKAGRPFIVVLPRYTTVTETVTPQTLTTQAGTNFVEITQASIDGLPLEVSYKAGVTVTVEEIENANLDNSVTVTIGE